MKQEMPTIWVVIKDGCVVATHDAPGTLDGIEAISYSPSGAGTAEALRDLLKANSMLASCQAGMVKNCICLKCATERANCALGAQCEHEFHHFGDQPGRRCAKCSQPEATQSPTAPKDPS